MRTVSAPVPVSLAGVALNNVPRHEFLQHEVHGGCVEVWPGRQQLDEVTCVEPCGAVLGGHQRQDLLAGGAVQRQGLIRLEASVLDLMEQGLEADRRGKPGGPFSGNGAEHVDRVAAPVATPDPLEERLPPKRAAPEHDEVDVPDVDAQLQRAGGDAHGPGLVEERTLGVEP